MGQLAERVSLSGARATLGHVRAHYTQKATPMRIYSEGLTPPSQRCYHGVQHSDRLHTDEQMGARKSLRAHSSRPSAYRASLGFRFLERDAHPEPCLIPAALIVFPSRVLPESSPGFMSVLIPILIPALPHQPPPLTALYIPLLFSLQFSQRCRDRLRKSTLMIHASMPLRTSDTG